MRVLFLRVFCVFLRLCNVLKEFPRLRSRYVLVLLFPKHRGCQLTTLPPTHLKIIKFVF